MRISNKNISAGTLSDTASVVRKFFDTLLSSIDKLLDVKGLKSIEYEEVEEEIDGQTWSGIRKIYKTGSKDVVAVTLFSNPKDANYYNIRLEVKGKPNMKGEKANVHKSKVEKVVTDWMDKNNLGSNEGEVKSSTRVLVKLQRVAGSTEDTINLLAINANCSIVLANDIVDEVLDNEEFVEQISEEPQTFEITETRDGQEYDVNPTDEEATPDDESTYSEMFKAAVKLHSDLQSIHWGAKGLKFYELHNQIDSLLWTSQQFIDTTAELLVEKAKVVPHVALYYETNHTQEIENFIKDGFDLERGLTYARTLLQDFIRVLESSYVNLDHDVQNIIDNWIRDLKKRADYFIDRQLLDSDTESHGMTPTRG